jgi:hypothetical protein
MRHDRVRWRYPPKKILKCSYLTISATLIKAYLKSVYLLHSLIANTLSVCLGGDVLSLKGSGTEERTPPAATSSLGTRVIRNIYTYIYIYIYMLIHTPRFLPYPPFSASIESFTLKVYQ